MVRSWRESFYIVVRVTVLVIGGTRATGLHAVQVLQRKGVRVRVLARNPDAAAATLERVAVRAEIIRGDVTRKETLIPAVAGVRHVIFTAGVRSGRFARESVVKATEYEGVLHTIEAARAQGFHGRFVYMTAIGVTRRSWFGRALNIWKGNTLVWRRRAEDAIRSSGVDYTIVRAAFLLNRAPNRHAISVLQDDPPLTLFEAIGRADVAEALVEATDNPAASRATFNLKWEGRSQLPPSWASLLNGLRPDPALARSQV